MDNHINNDGNNPINYKHESRVCEICKIEEIQTYFVENTTICENCNIPDQRENKSECCGAELDSPDLCSRCGEHTGQHIN